MFVDSPLPVMRLGRYEVVRRLGRGGMAEIFEARHVDLETRVAIKVIHPSLAAGDGAIDRVLREGRAAAAIHHPHVVRVLDVGAEERVPYLVMELLEGEDLASRIARGGPLAVEDIVELLLPVLSGVCAAHRAGIIHRDLKPSNIFLAQRHRGIEPVVVDFGISKVILPTKAPAPSSRVIAGTVQYMAPEQVRGSARASPKSDQYALGVILFECATGGAPFWDEDHYELLHSIMTAPIVPPSEINPRIPKAFDAVVLRALTRDPEARFDSVAALGGALLRFAREEVRQKWSEEFGPHATAVAELGSARKWRRSSVVGLLAILALAGVLGGAWTLRRPPLAHAEAEKVQTADVPPLATVTPAAAPLALAPGFVPPAAPPTPSPPLTAASTSPRAVAVKAPANLPVVEAGARRRPPAPHAPAPALERGSANIPIVE